MESMRCEIPEGKSGNWKVERFTVTQAESDFDRMRGMLRDGRYVRPGDYTRLMISGQTMMSDTTDELRDHIEPVRIASGVCLVNGLGLGCVVKGMLEKDSVDKVIVVEKSSDVIKLVAPYFEQRYKDRFEVIEGDAFEYKPPKGKRYDVVWHDIWLHLRTDNLEQMTKLHRKYGRRCEWQDSWSKKFLKRYKRQEEREERRFRWF
jgi:hypothetical protein